MYGGGGQRDPRPEYDGWYMLTDRERRQCARFMCAPGAGVGIDQLASSLEVTVDDAWCIWVTACQLESAAAWLDPLGDDYAGADRYEPDRPVLDVVGAPEIAEMIGVKLNTVHVWVKRDRADGKGRLPAPDAEVSWTPIWWRSTIVEWIEAGRTRQTA